MIYRRETTRVEFHDKGESVPRRLHATGIFRLPRHLRAIGLGREIAFPNARAGGRASGLLHLLPIVSRDNEQSRCVYPVSTYESPCLQTHFLFYDKLNREIVWREGLETECRSS